MISGLTKRLHAEKPTFASIDVGKFKTAKTASLKKLMRTHTLPEMPIFKEDQIDLRMAVKSSDSSSLKTSKESDEALINIQKYKFNENKPENTRIAV
jgi:hypothetical protein